MSDSFSPREVAMEEFRINPHIEIERLRDISEIEPSKALLRLFHIEVDRETNTPTRRSDALLQCYDPEAHKGLRVLDPSRFGHDYKKARREVDKAFERAADGTPVVLRLKVGKAVIHGVLAPIQK